MENSKKSHLTILALVIVFFLGSAKFASAEENQVQNQVQLQNLAMLDFDINIFLAEGRLADISFSYMTPIQLLTDINGDITHFVLPERTGSLRNHDYEARLDIVNLAAPLQKNGGPNKNVIIIRQKPLGQIVEIDYGKVSATTGGPIEIKLIHSILKSAIPGIKSTTRTIVYLKRTQAGSWMLSLSESLLVPIRRIGIQNTDSRTAIDQPQFTLDTEAALQDWIQRAIQMLPLKAWHQGLSQEKYTIYNVIENKQEFENANEVAKVLMKAVQ